MTERSVTTFHKVICIVAACGAILLIFLQVHSPSSTAPFVFINKRTFYDSRYYNVWNWRRSCYGRLGSWYMRKLCIQYRQRGCLAMTAQELSQIISFFAGCLTAIAFVIAASTRWR